MENEDPNKVKGSFEPNENKTEDWHAPFKGAIDIKLSDEMKSDMASGYLSFWVDVWPQETNGRKWYSLRLRRREYRPKEQPAQGQDNFGADLDDAIPF